jgi:hypothetical protein
MQMDEAGRRVGQWGDKPCDHPSWEKEYHLGSDTGDKVCSRCGHVVSFDVDGKPIPRKGK